MSINLEVKYAADVVLQRKGGELHHRIRLESAIEIILPVLRELERRASKWRFIWRLFLRQLIAALERWVQGEQTARLRELGLVAR